MDTGLEMSTTGSTQGQAPVASQLSQVIAPVIVKPLKINQPEPFDDSQEKLRAFYSQVTLLFEFNADRFANEKYKVLFASSYLQEPAFE